MTEFELRRAEANQFLEELGRLLLRETTEEPDEADLVGKAKPVMRAPALAGLHEIFLVRLAARLSWSRENITGVIPRTPGARKDSSLAYKITPICLVP